MAVFNAINKTPNVYIEEVQLAGPIPGVSTSIAAFVGPAKAGPIGEPVLVTNWSQFASTFGLFDATKKTFDPYIYAPSVMMAHAVRGFFDNGGAMCYIVRAGTGKPASRTLLDQAGKAVLEVQARSEGGNGTVVKVAAAKIVNGVKASKAEFTLNAAAAAGQPKIKAADAPTAAKFSPGDVVVVTEGATTETGTVSQVNGDTLTLENNLTNAFTVAAKLRITDLKIGQTRIRLDDVTGLEPGSYVKLTQGATTESKVVGSVEGAIKTIVLSNGLTSAYPLDAASPDVTIDSLEFTLTLGATDYQNLSIDPRHSRYVLKIVGEDKNRVADVALSQPVPLSAPPLNVPAVFAGALAGGSADDIGALTPAEYTAAIDALEKIDDVNILCVPDTAGMTEANRQTLHNKMIQHCEKMLDRFTVLDPPPAATPAAIKTYRDKLTSERGYAAIYYPQIVISHPAGTGLLTIPPSGHVAGVYARTDDQKGVHKAPANETLANVQGVELAITDDDHGPLNEKSINVIRAFPGRGIRVWGARTISTSTQWRYINVRRLMLYIEESIQEGTQFAVFEPNNTELWQRLKRTVTEFLERVWKSGALLGDKQEQAFRVRIDDELNPPATLALGQLIIEVKVAPTTPAEFIVFQIIQEPGRKIVSE